MKDSTDTPSDTPSDTYTRYPRRSNVHYADCKKRCSSTSNTVVETAPSDNVDGTTKTSNNTYNRYPQRSNVHYNDNSKKKCSSTSTTGTSEKDVDTITSVNYTRNPLRKGRVTLQKRIHIPTRKPEQTPTAKPTKLSPEEIEKRNLLLEPLVDSLFTQKLKNKNSRLSRGEYLKTINQYNKHYKWITVDMLKQRLKRRTQKHKLEREREKSTSIATNATQTINKGGRPLGTTNKHKEHVNACIMSAKAEICDLYENAMKEKNQSRVKRGQFQDIVKQVKSRRNLPANFEYSYHAARYRIKTNVILNDDSIPIGRLSPLFGIEKDIVNLLIILGKIGSPVPMGHAIKLINELIDGTVHQKRLIEHKKKNSSNQTEEEMGCIGSKYWYRFVEKYKNKIASKKGRRYELDRSKWTRYKNFKSMYDHVEEELVDAGLAVELQNPVYMDHVGNHVKEGTDRKKRIKGLKVKVDLKRPDLCVVLDEVGSNLSMIKDGHVGGKKYVCEKGDEPKTPSCKKDKHFTCLGLTALTGEPVMCVVIIDSLKENLLVHTGIDTSCMDIDDETRIDDDEFSFITRNIGKGKLYPGGPTCRFKYKEIPCLVQYSSGGGMTGEILTRIFHVLDSLQVFQKERSEGLRPFALLDGHQTRFELPFLSYINNPAHRWSVCIGVPYGTALWQVGDSTEQNGNFKMSMNRMKELIMNKRMATMTHVELVSTDIIPLVNYAWERSFMKVESNKRAICDRGWYPLNRNLLLEPILRETMTLKDLEEEKATGLHPGYDSQLQQEDNTNNITPVATSINSPSPNMRRHNKSFHVNNYVTLEGNVITPDINFGNGLTQHYIKNIIKKADREKALEGIQADKTTGESIKDKLSKVNRVTAGALVKCGSFVIGKDVEDVVRDRVVAKRRERRVKQQKEEAVFRKQQNDANAVVAKNTGKQLADWTATDLKILLKPDKTKEDGAMPSNKAQLIELYKKCVSRSTRMGLLGSPDVNENTVRVEEPVVAQNEPNNTTQLGGADVKGRINM
jgi:hypothetical protein